MLRDDGVVCGRVVEFPPLIPRWIPNEDTLFIVRLQCIALVSLQMGIGNASPYPEMGNIRFALIPQLIGCAVVKSVGGASVPDMDKCSKCFASESHCWARFFQHCSNPLREDTICPFCNTILLETCSDSVLVLNATGVCEFEHGIIHILPSLVILKGSDLLLDLEYHFDLVFVEVSE